MRNEIRIALSLSLSRKRSLIFAISTLSGVLLALSISFQFTYADEITEEIEGVQGVATQNDEGTNDEGAEGAESKDLDASGSDSQRDSSVAALPQNDEDGTSQNDEGADDEDASTRHPERSAEGAESKDLDASGSDSQGDSSVAALPQNDEGVQAQNDEGVQAQNDEVGDSSVAALPQNDEGVQVQATTQTITYVNMYRLYNPNSGEHFYTSSLDEATSVVEAGWRYEGVGWVAPSTSSNPVYRLYNPNAGDHHYTTSTAERDWLASLGWTYEGIGWYSDDSGSSIAVLRQYNPNAIAGAHNFTTSSEENSNLAAAGWSPEGIGWYASNQPTQAISGRWIVTAAWGSLERYWLDSTATIASSRLIDPTTTRDAGAGYRAYATSTGAVVRGSYDSGAGYVYLADNDGRLVEGTTDSWLVTSAYAGDLQRYYLVERNGVIVAQTSFFEVDGKSYFGQANVGYVVRNGHIVINGKLYTADNDGVLTERTVSGDATLDGYLLAIYESRGTDLYTLFNYVSYSYSYRSGSTWPSGEWSIPFAKEMYENRSGNCYRFAALFCWLAKGLGYDANVVAGAVPSYSGGRAAHGWVEIHMNGTTYICDPDMQHELSSYNWYMRTYSNAPCTYYR